MAKRHKMLNPLCAECEQEGIVSPTTVTDHITPINQGGDPWALSNLQALCGACHASKSGREAHHKAGGESKT